MISHAKLGGINFKIAGVCRPNVKRVKVKVKVEIVKILRVYGAGTLRNRVHSGGSREGGSMGRCQGPRGLRGPALRKVNFFSSKRRFDRVIETRVLHVIIYTYL